MTGPVRSISLAFAALRLVAAQGEGMTLSAIARGIGASPSTCLAVLRTLVSEGALVPATGKRYALAPGWAAVAGLLDGTDALLVAQAQPLLNRIAEQQDTAVGLWRIGSNERIELIALAESKSPTRIHMTLGQRQPLGAGSVGRALGAAQTIDRKEMHRRFASLRWRRPIDFAAYEAEVVAARTQGYAVDDGFAFAGVCSVACVIPATPTRFCLSASTFAGARDSEGVQSIGASLTMIASRIAEMQDRAGLEGSGNPR